MGKNLHSFLPIRYPRYAILHINLLNFSVSFYIFILHLEVDLSVVISGQIDDYATVFLFKKITQITGIHKYASTGAENTFHPLEKFGHIIQPSDDSGTIHEH